MHFLLTDRLHCPRCGPGFGLILRADQLVDRRALAGALGCSNCRDRFPIVGGFADLRPPPRAPLPDVPTAPEPNEASTTQLAALLGVTEGPGHVALIGPLAAYADALADRIGGIEVVAVDPGTRGLDEREGVSRVAAVGPPPFNPWTFRALAASEGDLRVEDLVPLVARGGRIAIERPPAGTADALERLHVRLLLRQADWVVGLVEKA